MTLVVGCQITGIKWTEVPNKDVVVQGGSSILKAYSYNPPLINNIYCTIGTFSVINIKNN